MSKEERKLVQAAKKAYKEGKNNKVIFNERRNELIQQLVKSNTPKWGGITVGFLNH